MEKDTPVIEVADLWFSYNGVPVLENVEMTVNAGDFLAVIGPNGGGKSTFLKLLLGLLEPNRGRIRVFGLPPKKAAPRIGYVPQDTGVNRSVPVSVMHVVLMGRMKGGGGWSRFSKEDQAVAEEALERVDMLKYSRRRMNELSGGQRQRVLVARAMVSSPEMLFLDEPTSSVDTKGQTEFYEFLRELNKTVTILVVSHDIMVLSGYIKSVACVSRNVHFHDRPEVTGQMLKEAYQCPVELIAHGLPHRVLPLHEDD